MTEKEILIKTQLASLADKKGFSSVILSDKPYVYSTKETMRWFMWLHEVRKWLWDLHKINVEVEPEKTLSVSVIKGWKGFIDTENYAKFMWDLGGLHSTEEEALAICIEKALNLLPDIKK